MSSKKLVTVKKRSKDVGAIAKAIVSKLEGVSSDTVATMAKKNKVDESKLAEELEKHDVEFVRYDSFSVLPCDWEKDSKIYIQKEW